MDRASLERLRKKYNDTKGGQVFDPEFRKVAERIFDKSGTRLAPFAGLPTFLALPYRPVDAKNPDFGDLQVAIVGVPMDLGVTNRPGSRFGPRALRAIERTARGPKREPLRLVTPRSIGTPRSATCRSPKSGFFASTGR